MNLDLTPDMRAAWQVPIFDKTFWLGRVKRYCIVIPVINEGVRIQNLLDRMKARKIAEVADIIIVDGGSSDGSVSPNVLKKKDVRCLLVKKGQGRLSAQLRCAYAFAMDQGYEGIITIDGNDKDDPIATQKFIEALNNGFDFVQASRFIRGGKA